MQEPLTSSLTLPIIFFFVSLIIRAIFSFLETSITALRLFKLKELAQKNMRYGGLFQSLEKTPHRVLMTILIANSVADVVTAALATHITETIFSRLGLSSGLGFSFGIGVASIAIIVFGEIVPKNLARSRGERLFQSMLWLINGVYRILSPLTSFFLRITNALTERVSGKKLFAAQDWVSSEKEVRFLIEYINEKGLIDPEKTAMLKNIFDLGNTQVKEVMIPATDVISVSANTSIQDTLHIFSEYHYTRLPVYEGNSDNVIGMVHQKDIFELLSKNEEKPLKDIIRQIMFIPESVRINQLLQELRAQHMHIAMVLNEHGSVTGLVTLEDALEEIVGEISDEHEAATRKIVPLQQGGWLVNASIPLEELEEFFKITFKTEDSVTLGGFLTEQLQHLPKKGERVVYEGYTFQIQKASHKRVRQVLIFEKKENGT